MSLKEHVASLDEVPEALREHYGPAEDGNGFELQIGDVGPLRNALRHEKQHRKNAEGRARELDTQVRHLRGLPPREKMTPREKFFEDAGKRLAGLEGDAFANEQSKLEAEMVPLIAAEIAEHEQGLKQRLDRTRDTIVRLMRERAAMDLVMQIRKPGIAAHVLLPLVLDRFDVQERDGDFAATAKGANGEPMSVEALAEELRANPAFAPLVAGTSEAEKAAHSRKVEETLGRIRSPALIPTHSGG
jgi:hypothetical protein